MPANLAPTVPSVFLTKPVQNAGFEATPDFFGWTVGPSFGGNATIDRTGGLISDDAGALLVTPDDVERGLFARAPSLTSAAFYGEAGETVQITYRLDALTDSAVAFAEVRVTDSDLVVAELFNTTLETGSTGFTFATGTLAYSGFFQIHIGLSSTDDDFDGLIGAQLVVGSAGVTERFVGEDSAYTFSGNALLAEASDPDGDVLTLVSVSTSNQGAPVSLNADGTITYDPSGVLNWLSAGQSVTDAFSFTVSDGQGNETTSIAYLRVDGANDAPQVNALVFDPVTAASPVLTLNLLTDASDPDLGDTLSVAPFAVLNSSSGRAISYSLNLASGVVTLDPAQFNDLAAGVTETLTFSYDVVDSAGASVPNTASIVISGLQRTIGSLTDADTRANRVVENTSVGSRIGLNVVATDPDGDAVRYAIVNPTGEFAIDADTGLVTVAGPIDFEAGASRTITISATSADGSSVTDDFTIAIEDSTIERKVTRGTEFTINLESDGAQQAPSIAAVAGASFDFIVTWSDEDPSTGTESILKRFMSADALSNGAAILVSDDRAFNAAPLVIDWPASAGSGSGGNHAILWDVTRIDATSGFANGGVEVARFATGGTVTLPQFSLASGRVMLGDAAADDAGTVHAVFSRFTDTVSDVFLSKFNGTGVTPSTPLQANSESNGIAWDPHVAAAGNRLLVTWTAVVTGVDFNFTDIRGRLFDLGTGNWLGSDFTINDTTDGDQIESEVTALANGNFVVVWHSQTTGNDGFSQNGVGFQLIDADGTKVGPEQYILAPDIGGWQQPKVKALGDGGFVIVWSEDSAQGHVVRAQLFSPEAEAASLPFTVSTSSFSILPDVAVLEDGRIAFVWDDKSGFDDEGSFVDAEVKGVVYSVSDDTNLDPDAVDDTAETARDTTLALTPLDNDTDADGDGLFITSARIVDGGGDIFLMADGRTLSYRPFAPYLTINGVRSELAYATGDGTTAGYSAYGIMGINDAPTVTIEYTVDDGAGGSDTGIATVTIRSTGNTAPVTQALTALMGEDEESVSVSPLQQASDADFNLLSINYAGVVLGLGTVEIVNGTDLVYRPGDAYDQLDEFELASVQIMYTINDGAGGFSSNFVTVTVAGDIDASSWTGTDANETHEGSWKRDRLEGGGGNDTLSGLGGHDFLDGGTGNDSLSGGNGNDTYILDNAGDSVSESTFFPGADDGGIDEVRAAFDYTLGQYFENLVLTGSAIQGFGNALDNIITGNDRNNILSGGSRGNDQLFGGAGNDVLNGGSGEDVLVGGSGNDSYYVNTAFDVVSEQENDGSDSGGVDWVFSTGHFRLSENVERLWLRGSAALEGYGNELDNILIGNDFSNLLIGEGGHDRIDGGAGADFLFGGAGNDQLNGGTGTDGLSGGSGNDSYTVDDEDDIVSEQENDGSDSGGIDWVYSSVSFELGDYVERLTLRGSDAIDGTGNGLGNILVGNGAGNRLSGGAGNDRLMGEGGDDTLTGDAGNDTLTGGAGSDTFVFAFGGGTDRVMDFSVAEDTFALEMAGFGIAAGALMADYLRIGSSDTVLPAAPDSAHGYFLVNTVGISWDANGSQAGGLTKLASFTPILGLTVDDFLFV